MVGTTDELFWGCKTHFNISEGTKFSFNVFVQVTIGEDSALVHPTRDRAKIPHGRRLPTRGHLMAVVLGSLDIFFIL